MNKQWLRKSIIGLVLAMITLAPFSVSLQFALSSGNSTDLVQLQSVYADNHDGDDAEDENDSTDSQGVVGTGEKGDEANPELSPNCGFIIGDLACHIGVLFIQTLFFNITQWFARMSAGLLDYFIWFTMDSDTYSGLDFINIGWGIVRDISNIFLILSLIYAAIGIAFNIQKIGGKKTVVTVIVVALLVNFSLFFTKVIIDASHILARVFYNAIVVDIEGTQEAADIGQRLGYTQLSVGLMAKMNPQIILTNSKLTEETKDFRAMFFIVYALMGVVNIMLVWVFIGIAFLLVGRTIQLVMSMIMSPFAFASMAVPMFRKQKFAGWTKWSEDLLGSAFLLPVFLFFMYLIILFFSVGPDSTLEMGFVDRRKGIGQQFVDSLIPIVFVIGFLKAAQTTAQSLAGEIAKMAAKGLKVAVGAVIGAAAGAVALGAAAAAAPVVAGAGAAAEASAARGAAAAGRAKSLTAEAAKARSLGTPEGKKKAAEYMARARKARALARREELQSRALRSAQSRLKNANFDVRNLGSTRFGGAMNRLQSGLGFQTGVDLGQGRKKSVGDMMEERKKKIDEEARFAVQAAEKARAKEKQELQGEIDLGDHTLEALRDKPAYENAKRSAENKLEAERAKLKNKNLSDDERKVQQEYVKELEKMIEKDKFMTETYKDSDGRTHDFTGGGLNDRKDMAAAESMVVDAQRELQKAEDANDTVGIAKWKKELQDAEQERDKQRAKIDAARENDKSYAARYDAIEQFDLIPKQKKQLEKQMRQLNREEAEMVRDAVENALDPVVRGFSTLGSLISGKGLAGVAGAAVLAPGLLGLAAGTAAAGGAAYGAGALMNRLAQTESRLAKFGRGLQGVTTGMVRGVGRMTEAHAEAMREIRDKYRRGSGGGGKGKKDK